MNFEKAVKVDFDVLSVRKLNILLTALQLEKPNSNVWLDCDAKLVRQSVSGG